MRSRKTLALAGVTVAVMAVLVPMSANAAVDDPAGDARACTMGTVPQVGEPDPDAPVVMSCFDTLDEAEAFIEEGAPGDYEQLVPQARAAVDAVTTSTVIIGRQYTGTGRTGSVLVQWGAGSGCYGVTYGFPSMPSGWNDVIQSSEGVSNCWVSDYVNASYGGAVANCTPYCTSLSATLEGKTSSVVYRPWGTYG